MHFKILPIFQLERTKLYIKTKTIIFWTSFVTCRRDPDPNNCDPELITWNESSGRFKFVCFCDLMWFSGEDGTDNSPNDTEKKWSTYLMPQFFQFQIKYSLELPKFSWCNWRHFITMKISDQFSLVGPSTVFWQHRLIGQA